MYICAYVHTHTHTPAHTWCSHTCIHISYFKTMKTWLFKSTGFSERALTNINKGCKVQVGTRLAWSASVCSGPNLYFLPIFLMLVLRPSLPEDKDAEARTKSWLHVPLPWIFKIFSGVGVCTRLGASYSVSLNLGIKILPLYPLPPNLIGRLLQVSCGYCLL